MKVGHLGIKARLKLVLEPLIMPITKITAIKARTVGGQRTRNM